MQAPAARICREFSTFDEFLSATTKPNKNGGFRKLDLPPQFALIIYPYDTLRQVPNVRNPFLPTDLITIFEI